MYGSGVFDPASHGGWLLPPPQQRACVGNCTAGDVRADERGDTCDLRIVKQRTCKRDGMLSIMKRHDRWARAADKPE